jgi:hypothetical protein
MSGYASTRERGCFSRVTFRAFSHLTNEIANVWSGVVARNRYRGWSNIVKKCHLLMSAGATSVSTSTSTSLAVALTSLVKTSFVGNSYGFHNCICAEVNKVVCSVSLPQTLVSELKMAHNSELESSRSFAYRTVINTYLLFHIILRLTGYIYAIWHF